MPVAPGLTGTISYISPKAEFTPRNVQTAEERSKLVYRVRINVDNKDGVLKQGMPVEAEIALGERRHCSAAEVMAAIEFQNVVKRYGKVDALRGVTLQRREGRDVRPDRPRRRRQDDGDSRDLRLAARRRRQHSRARQGPGQAAPRRHGDGRLPVAALLALRRSQHRREHRVLRGDPRRARFPGRGAIACSR